MPRRILIAGACALLAAPAAALADGRMIAIGDSIAGATNSYVERHAAALGITDVHKITSGDSTGQALSSDVPQAIALIDDPSDTRVVSVALGGHDYLQHLCANGWNRPDCAFADNIYAILTRLRAALVNDPGDEPLLMFAYYNPASGLGNADERNFDAGFLGRDGRVDLTGHGDDWGSIDVVDWVSCRSGATMVDAYPAFKQGGQALMLDELHPNSAGQQVLAELFEDPSRGTPTGPCPATTPFATTLPGSADGSAHGTVEPRLAPTRWWFEYGPTTAYGAKTAVQTLPASAGIRPVSAVLPAGVHHVRLVAENDVGRFAGNDQVVKAPSMKLWAAFAGRQSVRTLLARGAAVRVWTTGTSVEVRVLTGKGALLKKVVRQVTPRLATTIRVRLDPWAVRIVRRWRDPRLALTVTGRDGLRASPPVRLALVR